MSLLTASSSDVSDTDTSPVQKELSWQYQLNKKSVNLCNCFHRPLFHPQNRFV
jgi:hypothetical protein